jgi:hypothetical protein
MSTGVGMRNRPTEKRLADFAAKVSSGMTLSRLIASENLREDSVRRYLDWCCDIGLLDDGTRIKDGMFVDGDGNVLSVAAGFSRKIDKTYNEKGMEVTTVSTDVKTVDDALDKAGIDREAWDIERFSISSREIETKKWQHEINGTDNDPLWTVKVYLKRKPVNIELAANKISSVFSKSAPSSFGVVERNYCDSGIMCEIAFFDLHVGKHSWGRQVGEDYDCDIAIERFQRATDELLSRAKEMNPDLILIPIGNDLLHVDNLEGTTTKGTPQDSDGRYQRIYEKTLETLVRFIRKCREISLVHVIIIPGNHDELACFHIGAALKGYFNEALDVFIDNEPMSRKYFRWGNVLLGYVHGSKDDPDAKDLPLLMAVERPKDWSETTHREWHTGHIHKRKSLEWLTTDSNLGVHYRVLPALCSSDLWHFKKGFVAQPKVAEMYIWSKSDCFIGMFSSKEPGRNENV